MATIWHSYWVYSVELNIAIVSGLDEQDIDNEKTAAFVFDTASNTGLKNGVLVRLERASEKMFFSLLVDIIFLSR